MFWYVQIELIYELKYVFWLNSDCREYYMNMLADF